MIEHIHIEHNNMLCEIMSKPLDLIQLQQTILPTELDMEINLITVSDLIIDSIIVLNIISIIDNHITEMTVWFIE